MAKLKLLYLSCHSILEWDELTMFTEMGIECFSDGVYLDPAGHKSLPRPAVKGMQTHPDFEVLSRKFPKTHLPQEVIDWADVIMIMHTPEWVTENWDRIKHKTVIWRSIGQSTPHVENMIRRMRYEGLKIVRYSPAEKDIPDYLGEDAMIRFYKDPSEFCEWNGQTRQLINISQSLKARRDFCHYDPMMTIMEGFPATVFGSGNDDLGPLNGGEQPFELLKDHLRDNRAFVYGGTWPAPYTLSFIEAWMTGIPIIALGTELAENIPAVPSNARLHYYEIPSLIVNGVDGFYADNYEQLRSFAHNLLEDFELAKRIGAAGRTHAIDIFGKDNIKKQWEEFFKTL